MAEKTGIVTQVMGPVVDVRFDEGKLPPINNALTIPKGDILNVCDVEDYIYVYFGGQQAVIIPKRCIEGMEEQVKRALH